MKYPHLFSPIQLGDTLFRNRIFGAPTGYQLLTAEGYPTDATVAYYSRKARGGAASVAIGECVVDSHFSTEGMKHIPLDDEGARLALCRLTDGITRYGAVAVAELQHAGMYAAPQDGKTAYGPVDIANLHGGMAADSDACVRAMTEEQIEEAIEAFANAAAFAKRCGFGMVMVHGGHGWLLSQFMSPLINTRTDRWGGSLENRMRLPIEVCKRIKAKCGNGYPVEFRMSVTEANPDGYGVDDGVEMAVALDGHVDLIHCSTGNHEVRDAFVVTHPSMFMEDGANSYLAARVKVRNVKTPVASVGAFTEPALMERKIAAGEVDVIDVARQLLADPDMPIKARTGRDEDITKCIRCFACFSNLINAGQFCCALNPETGIEGDIAALPPIKTTKRVLIAGGGIAGMQAALTAARRGHDVVLCEKSDALGGVLLCEEDVSFKKNLSDYLALQAKRVSNAKIDVRLNTPVTPELAAELAPDVIIAALGARPSIPPISGIENTTLAEDVYRDASSVGKRVAILGGGLVGTELALYLADFGAEVTLIEMQPMLTNGGNILHGLALDLQLRQKCVNILLSTRVAAIEDGAVRCEAADGESVTVECDSVVNALGQRPLRAEAEALRFLAPEFHLIGDGLEPKNIRAATRAAYFTAMNIGAN